VPVLTGVAGRLERALQNFVETFPLFAAAVLIVHVTATHSWMTEWGVQLYFWARVAHLALYAAGVFLLRSLAWNVAALGSSWSFCHSSEPWFVHRTCGLLRFRLAFSC